jgi:hypothetical protein
VRITDPLTTLSRKTAPPGTILFSVTNAGRKPHSFSVAGYTTPSLKPGRSATLKVKLTVAVGYAYQGTSRGVFHIAAPAPATFAPVPSSPAPTSPTPVTTFGTGLGPCTNPSTTTVIVTMTDAFGYGAFSFAPNPIQCGTVTFELFNTGQSPHGLLLIDPTGTALPTGPTVGPLQNDRLTLTLDYRGQYEWRDSLWSGPITVPGYISVR